MALTALHPADPRRIGGYRLVGRLGAGGMGVVYLAHAADGSLVAVKRLHDELADDPAFRTRFRQEAVTLTRVRGAYTATVLAVHTDETPQFLVLDYVPGPTLTEHVTRSGPLPAGSVRGFAAGLAAALSAVHRADVVHRDLKPANVLLSDAGPKVIDFGIARISDATHLTRTGAHIGSPGFMAPEQLTGEAGAPADVFAWALTVAFAATGRAPFGAGAPETIFYRVLHTEPDIAGVPDDLLPLLSEALSKVPAERPTAARLVAALTGEQGTAEHPDKVVADLLSHTWIQTQVGPEPPKPLPAKRSRRRLLPIAAICSVILLAAGAVYGSTHSDQLVAGRPTHEVVAPIPANIASGQPSSAPTTTRPADPATQVLTYQPWTPQGLSPRITATATTSGSCWISASKSMRPEAFRCTAGSTIHDPCFSSPFQSTSVACPVLTPDDVVVINLTAPLPYSTGSTTGGLQAWLMVLSNGQKCSAAGGATTTLEGMRLNYHCTNGFIYGDLDDGKPTWTARFQANDNPILETTTIATVYR